MLQGKWSAMAFIYRFGNVYRNRSDVSLPRPHPRTTQLSRGTLPEDALLGDLDVSLLQNPVYSNSQ